MIDKNRILTFEDFSENMDAPYRLVLLASKRAKEIIRDAKVQGKILEMKPTELALRTILNPGDIDLLQPEPPREPEPFQDEAEPAGETPAEESEPDQDSEPE